MSDVASRTIYYEITGGYFRFHDWAKVNVAGFGDMMQPYQIRPAVDIGGSSTTDRANYSSTDPERIITEMKEVSLDRAYYNPSYDHEYLLHGGFQVPRSGR